MNLISAHRAPAEKLGHFLENNQNVNKEGLIESGYVVEIEEQIQGCFSLERVDEGVYWLKQLYITKAEAAKLPVLLESILNLAKEQHAKKVYVQSHQPVVDMLLEALQFHPQKEKVSVGKPNQKEGNWWTYNVS
ncbi:hypothetical protein KFZ58_16755 [Virgibacillus sp. NKC19-16]|uniref:hypothetical protein n=1 Tax=Virgibacillus salidurans TaxID=2831673 RepID=UPI001F3A907D|nr:hypothetical protein [Virgibacillus sp. NKC19-16]UJL45995.1 hypothetical protein KFZ58_16755 [Virgibacillus sp. NKC19-16]